MSIFKKIICCVSLLLSSLVISIGYAELSKDLEIKGIITGEMAKTIFITNVDIISTNNAQLEGRNYTGTVLTSNTTYTRNNSSVVLEVTFYNGSELIYEYDREIVNTHTNNNVNYQVANIVNKQEVKPHTYVKLEISFTSSATGNLLSIINFNFVVADTEDNVGVNNHASLIDAMVNDPTHGLNNSNSYLNNQIASRKKGSLFVPARDTLGSMAITQGNSLESMFGSSYATNEKIAFIIQFFDTNNDKVIDYYYIFTTPVILGENGSPNIPIGSVISPVYRAKVSYNVEEALWEAEEIIEGYATSAYYEESQPNWNINRSKIPSFDPDTWKEGKEGSSFTDAVWTTVNQYSLICSTTDASTPYRYYKVTIPANSSYTLFVNGDNETNANEVLIEIFDSNQALVSSNYATNTFPTSTSSKTYFIRLSGSETIDFKFIRN